MSVPCKLTTVLQTAFAQMWTDRLTVNVNQDLPEMGKHATVG